MTTEHYLWAIFALLWVALVLVVVTARRGPWQRPRITGQDDVRFIDVGPAPYGMGKIEVLPRSVDPLWGKSEWRP